MRTQFLEGVPVAYKIPLGYRRKGLGQLESYAMVQAKAGKAATNAVAVVLGRGMDDRSEIK